MSNVRFMYIRNTKSEPIGCVAISLDRSKHRVEYGLSMRNPLDAISNGRKLAFDREKAQKLATLNLVAASGSVIPNRTFIHKDATMHDITEAVMKDIVARGMAPSGAVKFAKSWIRSFGL